MPDLDAIAVKSSAASMPMAKTDRLLASPSILSVPRAGKAGVLAAGALEAVVGVVPSVPADAPPAPPVALLADVPFVPVPLADVPLAEVPFVLPLAAPPGLIGPVPAARGTRTGRLGVRP